jgi:hypothetical protein
MIKEVGPSTTSSIAASLPKALNAEEVHSLTQRLYYVNKSRRKERQLAAYCLAYAGPDIQISETAIKCLVSMLQPSPTIIIGGSSIVNRLFRIIALVTAAATTYLWWHFARGERTSVLIAFIVVFFGLFVSVSFLAIVCIAVFRPRAFMVPDDEVYNGALWSLGVIGGVPEILPIAQLVLHLPNSISLMATQCLGKLLPKVTEENASELYPNGPNMFTCILEQSEITCASELLRVLGLIGGETELDIVRKWANDISRQDIAAVAQDALAKIEERLCEAKDVKTLLRPSTNINSDNLVRPVNSIDANPDQLLRPVDLHS